MKRCLAFVTIFAVPVLQAQEPRELPAGFSRDPNCKLDTICLTRDNEVAHAEYFAAIQLAAQRVRRSSPPIKAAAVGTQAHQVEVILFGESGTKSYSMEWRGDGWVITGVMHGEY